MGAAEDKKRYLELDAQEKALRKERDEIGRKMQELLHSEGMTKRKRKLAQKYDKASFTHSFVCFLCPLLFLFENSLLALQIKYWPIRKCYIIPRKKYEYEILRLNERIKTISGSKIAYLHSRAPSDTAVEIIQQAQKTHVEVKIDYDINPGDCGDCY